MYFCWFDRLSEVARILRLSCQHSRIVACGNRPNVADKTSKPVPTTCCQEVISSTAYKFFRRDKLRFFEVASCAYHQLHQLSICYLQGLELERHSLDRQFIFFYSNRSVISKAWNWKGTYLAADSFFLFRPGVFGWKLYSFEGDAAFILRLIGRRFIFWKIWNYTKYISLATHLM